MPLSPNCLFRGWTDGIICVAEPSSSANVGPHPRSLLSNAQLAVADNWHKKFSEGGERNEE